MASVLVCFLIALLTRLAIANTITPANTPPQPTHIQLLDMVGMTNLERLELVSYLASLHATPKSILTFTTNGELYKVLTLPASRYRTR